MLCPTPLPRSSQTRSQINGTLAPQTQTPLVIFVWRPCFTLVKCYFICMSSTQTGVWDREAGELLRALVRLQSVREAKRFIRDLMTTDEIRMIVDRWRVARMLDQGVSYREIGAETGLSSRTIARISRWMQDGEGGYRAMIAKSEASS